MSKNAGWIKIHRSLANHWLWEEKPFSKGQAWVDLIMLANHKENKKVIKGNVSVFPKGTVVWSISMLSDRWGWDRRKVNRFLMALQSDGMVSVNSTTNGTTITLIKYSFFQDYGTSNGTKDAQRVRSSWYINKNVKNVKNIKNNNTRAREDALSGGNEKPLRTGSNNRTDF